MARPKSISPKLLRTAHDRALSSIVGRHFTLTHSFLHFPRPNLVKLSDVVYHYCACIDHLAQLVQVFRDFCDGIAFILYNELDFDLESYDIVPFFIYTLTKDPVYVFYVPYMTEEAGLLLALMMRGKGFSFYCDLELDTFFLHSRVKLYNMTRSW